MSIIYTEEERRAKRNLKPHAEAIAAMYLYGQEYSQQRGGSMDFWDRLGGQRQRLCRELVQKIKETRAETNAEKPF